MKKKLLALLLICAGALSSLAGCGSDPGESGQGDDAGSGEKVYNVGICQLVQHDALDAATEGFQAALKEKLGDQVKINLQNASGDSNTCGTIANQFVSSNVDLIMANATAPLQSSAAATNSIPILGPSIPDYATALQIADWTGSTGMNISGTSDLAPLTEQAAMLKELFPDAKNIGMLYCSGEPNSSYQVNIVKTELEGMGYTCKEYTFADSNDIAAVAATAVAECDVIYIPTDNTAASATNTINNVCLPAKIPVVTGEENMCRGCGVATLSISYYDIGYQTGLMAYEILVNGADISTMEIQYAPDVTKKYNAEICAQLGITIPEGYTEIGPAAEE